MEKIKGNQKSHEIIKPAAGSNSKNPKKGKENFFPVSKQGRLMTVSTDEVCKKYNNEKCIKNLN